MSITRRAGLALGLLWLAACAPLTAVDRPLAHVSSAIPERYIEQIAGGRSPELLVLVAFSGGGTRAAAFAYGVLQELASIEIDTDRGRGSLLREVDVISSVSGGSFTSAYYGLRGDRIFEEFEPRFLRADVEGDLLLQVFNPVNWLRLLSASYGRSDLAAQWYAEHIFDDATFAALARPDAPAIVINATDLGGGNRFPFTPPYFAMICADLAAYPISRAVAASSAVPILLSPVTLESFAGTCGYRPPPWLAEAAQEPGLSRRKVEAREFEAYLDRSRRPYIHLVDGGIADNLGLRSFYEVVSLEGGPAPVFAQLDHPALRRILIVSVNAAVHPDPSWSLERVAPSLSEVIHSVTADQIDRYSFETIELVKGAYTHWAKALSTPEQPVSFHFVEVGFDAVPDPARREALNAIGTNFHLSDAQVDALTAAAREVLRESPDMKAFLEEARGGARPTTTAAARE
jgi:NTE family protein